MMLLRRTCREAAALMVRREDLALGVVDRLALRLHLMACDACPKFERQMLAMRNGMRQWRAYMENDDADSVSPEIPKK